MSIFLKLAFLFFIGSVIGWCLELFFRRLTSKEKKWVNPGFCTGPYLPIYGVGLCILYIIASFEKLHTINSPVLSKIVLLIAITVSMTIIEYIAGVLALKIINVRLWDYSDEWKNIQGIICPKFSAIWALLGAIYYFLIHPYILDAIQWLSQNLAFSFVIGLFFGIFIIDVANSIKLTAILKKYAEENDVIIRLENVKLNILKHYENRREKYRFFTPFRSDRPISDHLKEMLDSFEKRIHKTKH